MAKDINYNEIRTSMKLGGNNVEKAEISDSFANYFNEKVKSIVESCNVENDVYNGKKKVNCNDENFMTLENVTKAIK